MHDSYAYLIAAISGITMVTLLCLTALRAWQAWLEFRRAELEHRPAEGAASANTRIEVADLKERIRKLEAIAAGVDL